MGDIGSSRQPAFAHGYGGHEIPLHTARKNFVESHPS
jgi:hypothetical protein